MYAWMIGNKERAAALVGASAWAAPLVALAAPTLVGKPGGVPPSFATFDKTIGNIFSIVITVAGVAFVVLFLLGGIMYLTSAGAEEPSKKARQLMLDAVIGLGIVVTAWAVGTYVLYLIGINTTPNGSLDTTPVKN